MSAVLENLAGYRILERPRLIYKGIARGSARCPTQRPDRCSKGSVSIIDIGN